MLIFFDIDGTLMEHPFAPMSESTKRAIEHARANGHICMINTGRTLKLVGENITGQTKFDGLLLGCGTMITYHDKVLFHKTFSKETGKRITRALCRYRIDAVLEGSENNYLNSEEKMFHEVFVKYIREYADWSYGTYRAAMGRFDKFYAYTEDRSSMKAFQEEFAEELEYVDREKGYFEIMPKGCSKASAMEYLAEYLNIPMEQTAAIGDSTNDLPMLQRAHYAIAMGNSTSTVKEIADYITTDVDKDGIERALRWLGVI